MMGGLTEEKITNLGNAIIIKISLEII